MKDKLRELAARWKTSGGMPYTRASDQGYASGLNGCADELLAILDAEGDGEAVPEFWCAVHVDTGEVGLCMSTVDANNGEAARTEVNDWINDDLQDNPQNSWSIKPMFQHPPAQPAQETPCSLREALNVIEHWGRRGNTLNGADVDRFRALADKIAPVQEQPGWKVPNIMTSVPYGACHSEEYEPSYADGWNACRAAMLAASPTPPKEH